MNLAQYLDAKKEILNTIAKLRGDHNHGRITKDKYNKTLCALIKKSSDIDTQYGENVGYFPSK